MLEDIYMYISLVSVTSVIYLLTMRPFNLRYKHAFNRILGKEIARTLYQKVHPEYSYDNKYRPDDLQSQLILNTALEEFARICQQKQEGIQ